jgi:hypothetical protein
MILYVKFLIPSRQISVGKNFDMVHPVVFAIIKVYNISVTIHNNSLT